MIRKTFLKLSSLVALHTTWLTAADTKLTLLHINDHHSHLTEASAGYVNIYGADIPASVRANNGGTNEIRAYYGGYPRLVTAFLELEVAARHSGRDVLKLHAGDAITGTTYFTLFEGAADAKLMTHVCFDAFTLGNHEFDKGDTGLARFLRAISNETEASSTCAVRPAILGANIVPRIGSPIFGGGVPAIEHSRVFNLSDGEKVGVIGITIARKTMESSQPDPGTILLDERETAQAEIAALTAIGVNKIVLLTHIGYPNDQQWIAQLPGVDVVIGGDSHSLLGDEETRIMSGFAPLGDYATMIEKPDGTKTCVVQAWDYAKLIGNLNIDFDGDGNVIACHGSPIFPLNPDKVTVRDANPRYDLSAADAAEVIQSLTTRTAGQAREFMEDVDAASDLAFYTAKVNELANTVVTSVPARISLEAGGYESGACDLVAQGFLLNPLSSADIAIQNRGGCRSSIEEGTFTVNDAYTLLPFANTMVNIFMTGQQIKNVLEDALDFYLDPSGSWGAYPRASGLRFDVNEAMPKGSRVSNVEVNPKLAAAEWTTIDMSANYTVVTNNFIATPRDGYYEFGKIDAALKVDTYVEYAQSFIEYASTVQNLNPVGVDRASTQNWSDQLPDTLAPSLHVTKSPTASPIMTSVTSSPVATPSCTMDKTKKGKCKKTKKAKKSKDSKSPKSPKGRIRQ